MHITWQGKNKPTPKTSFPVKLPSVCKWNVSFVYSKEKGFRCSSPNRFPPSSSLFNYLHFALEKDGKIRGEKGDGIATNQTHWTIGFLVSCGTAVFTLARFREGNVMTESVGELRDDVVDVGPSVYCFSLMVTYLALSCFSFYGGGHNWDLY